MTAEPVVVAGRYELETLLARGGMGEVWRGHDRVLSRPVAVKLLRTGPDDPGREQLRAEARYGGALRHPGLATVHDSGEDADSAWIVMELVDGEPLTALLEREAPLPADRTLDLLAQAGDALQTAHRRGLVHRDVKPGNLLLRRDGSLALTDFGIAAPEGAGRLGTVVGTAAYLAPEQAEGQPVTPATDVYALGVVAYECLAGRRPFEGETADAVVAAHLADPPPPLPDTVPVPVQALVQRALAKDPADRQPDGATLAAEAVQVRAELPAAAAPARRHSAAHRLHGRAVWLAVPLLLVAVLALGARSFFAGAGRSVEVPAVAGQSGADAARVLREAGLRVLQRSEADAQVPVGVALGTDPAAGTRLRPDGEVVLVTSGVPLEQLLGQPWPRVRVALEQQGLRPRAVFDTGAPPAGRVRALDPSPLVEPGAEVVVRVARQRAGAPPLPAGVSG